MSENRKVQLGIEVADNTKPGIDSAKREMKGLTDEMRRQGEQQQQQAKKPAEGYEETEKRVKASTGSMIAQIQRLTAEAQAGGKNTADYIRKLAEIRGLDGKALEPYIQDLERARAAQNATAKSFDNLGMTAKQTTAALRQVPAQFTDIIVSLQGGQAPMTVLLQQGGQLKDVFGGVGAAAQALGGYIKTLITPVNVLAAGIATLAVGFELGRRESEAFAKGIILTGNAAGTTVGQLNQAAVAIDAIVGTQGKAAESLNAFVAAGVKGTASLTEFTTAAIRFERVTGQAVGDTAKQFADLAKDPLQATLKLNEGMNFLTQSTYEQIKALVEAGRETEAANVAQKAFADTLNDRATQLESNLGMLERGWKGITSAVKEAWDAIKGIGRQVGTEGQLSAVNESIATLERAVAERNRLGINTQLLDAELTKLKERQSILQSDARLLKQAAEFQREQAEAVKARAEFDKQGERFLDRRVKMEREIAAVQQLALRGKISEAELEKRIADIRASYDKKTGSSSEDRFTAGAEAAKEWARFMEQFGAASAKAQAQTDGLTKSQALLIEYLGSEAYLNMAEPARQLALQAAYAAIGIEQQTEAEKARLKIADEAYKAEAKRIEALDRSATSVEAQVQRLMDEEKAAGLAAEKNISLAEAIELVAIARLREQQTQMMGNEDAVMAIQREIEAREKLIEVIRSRETRKAAEKSAEDAAKEWERSARQIERSLTDALMRGFESGKDFARVLRDTVVNMFKTMVLRPVVQAIVSPVAGALTGAMGFSGAANAAQLSGGMNAIGGIKSIYDTIVGGFQGLGNSVAFAANDIGAWLVNNTSGVLNRFGGSLMSNAGAIGTVGSYLGGAAAGIGAGRMISNGYAISGSGNGVVNAGTAIGAVLGGPIGAAIGGAVGGLVNRTFGRKLKDQGIQGTFGGEGFEGESFQFFKGGLFRSDKTKTSALDPALDNALDTQFLALKNTSLALGDVLGVAGTALDGFTSSIKVSFNGLNEQQIQEKLNEVFGNIGESMAQQVLGATQTITERVERQVQELVFTGGEEGSRLETRTIVEEVQRVVAGAGAAFIKEGETAAQALQRLAGSLVAVNGAFDALGRTMLEASLQSGDLASKIVEAFGGLEQFSAATASYLQNFYSDTERLDTAARQLRETFSGLGLTLPATKDAYRQLVDAQDLTTESGRKTYAALLTLSGAFAEITTAAEQAAEAARRAAQEAVNAATEAARDALRGLQNAVSAERDRLQAAFDLQSDALSDSISDIGRVLSTLTGAIESIRGTIADTSIASQTAARLTLQSVLTAVQGGQAITGFEPVIEQASDTLTRNDPNLYQTREQFVRAQAQAAGLLQELNEAGGKQLSAAELQLQALKDGFDAEMRRLDDLVLGAERQLDALLGIDSAVRSVEQALREFRAALDALSGKTPAGTGKPSTPTAPGDFVIGPVGSSDAGDAPRYYKPFANAPLPVTDPAEIARFDSINAYINTLDWGGGKEESAQQLYEAAKQYGVSQYDIAVASGYTQKDIEALFAAAGIPKFARGGFYAGGVALVGEEGPEIINFDNPGQVYTAPQTQDLLGNREVVAELRALRSEVIELRAQSRRTADAVNGNPEAPMLVETVA